MDFILFAEAGTLEGGTAWWNSGVMWYMYHGGIFMWPILAMAIVALGVVIERYRTLKMLTSDNQDLREKVLELLYADRADEALKLCNSARGPVPAILSVGLRKFLLLRRLNHDPGQIQEHIDKAMNDYGAHIVAALEKNLWILALTSSVAPMVGSVGTVVGMVILFQDIVAQFGTVNIVIAAAAGIQVKLIVTVWGLLVGIPAYVAFNYFTTVIDRYVLQVEESASELFEAVTLRLALERQTAGASNNGAAAGSSTAIEAAKHGGAL